MIKHKYKMEMNGQVCLQTDNLEEFIREAEHLKNRRTGRTTRMLFAALASNAENIYIVAQNSVMREVLTDTFLDMLDNLKFIAAFNKAERTVTNFGKTYHFVTKEQIGRISFYTKPNFETFRDEL